MLMGLYAVCTLCSCAKPAVHAMASGKRRDNRDSRGSRDSLAIFGTRWVGQVAQTVDAVCAATEMCQKGEKGHNIQWACKVKPSPGYGELSRRAGIEGMASCCYSTVGQLVSSSKNCCLQCNPGRTHEVPVERAVHATRPT